MQATDAGEVDGVPYLVMELFEESIDLAKLVKRRGPLPVAEACAVAMQAAAGLQAAHDQGLIHRDVKPSNLLLTRDGTVKVLDLGLALLDETDPLPDAIDPPSDSTDPGAEALTSASLVLGTKKYMAPEQRRDSHRIDARADIYGLGKTLCCLLTGTPAPTGLLGVPRGLQAVLAKMLAERPEDRYATATEAGRALASWARGADLARLHAGMAPLPPRRWPGLIAAVVIVCLVGLATMTRVLRSTSDTASRTDAERLQPGKLPMTPNEAQELQSRWAAQVHQPIDLAPPIGPIMRLVPPGELGLSGELRVRITRPYYLGVYEVTVGEFAAFVAETNHLTLPETNGKGACLTYFVEQDGILRPTHATKPEFNWRSPGHFTTSDRHPVSCIGWDDSVAYCDWLSKKLHANYRLPSEAEWRWASRAGMNGDSPPDDVSFGWLKRNCREPQPVGGKRPNPWGLYDLIGNVG